MTRSKCRRTMLHRGDGWRIEPGGGVEDKLAPSGRVEHAVDDTATLWQPRPAESRASFGTAASSAPFTCAVDPRMPLQFVLDAHLDGSLARAWHCCRGGLWMVARYTAARRGRGANRLRPAAENPPSLAILRTCT